MTLSKAETIKATLAATKERRRHQTCRVYRVKLCRSHLNKDTTHLELNPIVILGISACLIPYPEYNRGDRINFGAKMVGQAIGMMSRNFVTRTDTKFNVLAYPQTPLIKTSVSDI
ncbi:MAG: hypothetical protein ACFFCO_10435, partial [Promethearchaeota archaeon]